MLKIVMEPLIKGPDRHPLMCEIPFDQVYISRPSVGEVEEDAAEALAIYLHTIGDDNLERCDRVGLGSTVDRDVAYHVFCYYKLSPNFKGFDRWQRDLSSGNFTVLKANYKQLWGSTDWTVYTRLRQTAGHTLGAALAGNDGAESSDSEGSSETDSEAEWAGREVHGGPAGRGVGYDGHSRDDSMRESETGSSTYDRPRKTTNQGRGQHSESYEDSDSD